jgi:hypothetical protein
VNSRRNLPAMRCSDSGNLNFLSKYFSPFFPSLSLVTVSEGVEVIVKGIEVIESPTDFFFSVRAFAEIMRSKSAVKKNLAHRKIFGKIISLNCCHIKYLRDLFQLSLLTSHINLRLNLQKEKMAKQKQKKKLIAGELSAEEMENRKASARATWNSQLKVGFVVNYVDYFEFVVDEIWLTFVTLLQQVLHNRFVEVQRHHHKCRLLHNPKDKKSKLCTKYTSFDICSCVPLLHFSFFIFGKESI